MVLSGSEFGSLGPRPMVPYQEKRFLNRMAMNLMEPFANIHVGDERPTTWEGFPIKHSFFPLKVIASHAFFLTAVR